MGAVLVLLPSGWVDDTGHLSVGIDDLRVAHPCPTQIDSLTNSSHLAMHERVSGLLVCGLSRMRCYHSNAISHHVQLCTL